MDFNKAALEMHETHHGKVGIVSKVEVKTRDDLSTAYTPGVAEPCRKIKENPDDVYKYTFKSNMVAVVSNGTAVLGLGDIGPEAGLPVMEGKAVLFKEFGGVDAFPICIDAHDAASVIASDVSGGDLTAFVAQMNARAKELGCTDTTFTCVHGLYDYGNVSTAEDLAKIAAACYANETYMQAANTLTYTLPATNLHQNERTIKSTNLMLDPEYAYHRDYVRGMKTGFTTLAGRCFVTFAQQDGHTYGLVVLGSDMNNIYRECAEILDWAFSSFSDRQLVDTETVLTTIPLTKCRTEEAVELYAADDLSGYGHADDEVTFEFSVPESTSATVKEGAVLGTATVYLDGYEMGTVDLVTHKEYVSDFRTDTKTTLLLMAALIGILIVLGFLTMVAGGGSLNLRRRSRSRRR